MLTASSSGLLLQIISTLQSKFSMTDLGFLNFFLGIAVSKYHHDMFLSLQKYATEILDRANMSNCKPARTPAYMSTKFDGTGPLVSNLTLYHRLVSALQYLTFT